jgi:hypothetical protein
MDTKVEVELADVNFHDIKDNKEEKKERRESKVFYGSLNKEAMFDTDKMTFAQKKSYMISLREKIDDTIGYYFWKKYISSAFWSNLSTPVNLTITLLTALMTAQATTQNLLSEDVYYKISVANLLISVLNTFFRPHSKVASNIDGLSKWNDLGCKFEVINAVSSYTEDQIDNKIKSYTQLLFKMNEVRQNDSPDNVNFLTDLIFLISLRCCLKDKYMWSNLDNRVTPQLSRSNSENNINKK